MNKTDIEWADMTWNPVVGCKHGCEYCYARRIAERFGGYDKDDGTGEITTHNPLPQAELHQPLTITRHDGKTVHSPFPFGFEPTLLHYRLEEPQRKKKPQTIFVCSMADLFGDWVPDNWITKVFDACCDAPRHRYLFLTKNPSRYIRLARAGMLPLRDNFWYGSTVTTPDMMFWWSDYYNTFVSIEPILEAFKPAENCPVKKVDWIIIGAMSGPGSKEHQPKKEWIAPLVEDAQALSVPVFMKNSLIPIVGEENMSREFPWTT